MIKRSQEIKKKSKREKKNNTKRRRNGRLNIEQGEEQKIT